MTTSLPTTSDESATLQQRVSDRAYFIWLESGRPQGQDLTHWQAALEQVTAARKPSPRSASTPPEGLPPHLSIRHTLDAHQADPTHRFHGPGAAHDARLDVVAGEARQRVRSRSSNLQPQTAVKERKSKK